MSGVPGLRLARTLRRVRPVQVLGRIAAPLRRRITKVRLDPGALPAASDAGGGTRFPVHDPWNDAAALREGRFRFLAETRDLGWPPDWRAPGASLLWTFNLHYQHYLPLLEPRERQALVTDWIDRNRDPAAVAWHPYVSSQRLAAWCRWLPSDADCDDSLARQAEYLFRNVESQVLGNHLLENARALILAGARFGRAGRAGRWFARGEEILRGQLREQVLPDGGHFERSPMYHALMFGLLAECLPLLDEEADERSELGEALGRMATFLSCLTHPDGDIALLNDATREIAPPPAALLAYARTVARAEPVERTAFPDSGYYVWARDPAWIVLDAGAIGPPYLPAHAHADIFTYEFSLHGRRLVVDTGVSGYAAGPARSRDRGTAAHNTVTIDDRDQAELWGTFRAARRFAPRGVEHAEGTGELRLRGAFAGYASLIGDDLHHRRTFSLEPGSRTFRVVDEVTGNGRHSIASRVHLHPAVRIERSGRTFRLSRDEARATLVVENGEPDVRGSVYCPEFGVEIPSRAITLEAAGPPATLAYRIEY